VTLGGIYGEEEEGKSNENTVREGGAFHKVNGGKRADLKDGRR